MKNTNMYTAAEALQSALEYAGIAADENRCLLARYDGGLYHILVRTLYQKYEFYVDAESGEVLGISAEPSLDLETLCACDRDAENAPAAA